MDPTGRICTAQLCGPKILASCRSSQAGNNLLEEFIKFWVLRMVFFHAFVSGFCTKVRRHAVGRCHELEGRLGYHKDEHNSLSSETRFKAQLLRGGKRVLKLCYLKHFPQRSESVCASAHSSSETSLRLLSAMASSLYERIIQTGAGKRGKYWDHQGTVKTQNEKTIPWSCLVQPGKINAIFKYAGVNTKLVDRVGTRTSNK